jgi:predicted ATPase/class 3 adenylate cyclase
MAELPSGTVTFLFTDVEGSTRLLAELGAERYAEALDHHRRVIRRASSANGGVEVDTQGDSFFIAFVRATDAFSAAEEAQRNLAGGPIRVRMGLHTGEPLRTQEGYVGADVHKAARIAAAGHGGQVLVSTATRELLDRPLKDLGEHRLKDLSAPERLYQLSDGEFPRLRSLYRTNMPLSPTPFLGRGRELREVTELLGREDVRLLTLIGPGGAGKTRLALQGAAEASEGFPDGVWWVPLAPLRDPSLVLGAVAQALGVSEEPARPLGEVLAERLSGKRELLVLDSAEHLLPDLASDIVTLRTVPGPSVLVTSRERIQLQGEHVYDVPSLAPEDSIELFLVRASSLGAPLDRSAALDELCRRLDDLPLAIELAAARARLFSVEQLLDRLGERLDLLTAGRDADPRQRTLGATIQWSYDLLDPREQELFRRLSVFAGSCSLEAAESVCDADPDTLQSLLDKSLVRRREGSAEPRYWMLETIREFAAARLDETPEARAVRRRHADYFLQIAEPIAFSGERASLYEAWTSAAVDDDDSNFRVALEHVQATGDSLLELRLAVALRGLFWIRGSWNEARRALELALDRDDAAPPELRSRALEAAVYLANRQADWERVEELGVEFAALTEKLGDEAGLARGLRWLAHAASAHGDAARAASLLDESERLSRQSFPLGLVGLVVDRALGKLKAGDYSSAEALLDEAVELADEFGSPEGSHFGHVVITSNFALLALLRGRTEEARGHLREVLAAVDREGQPESTFWAIDIAGVFAAQVGDYENAARLWGAAEQFGHSFGAALDDVERLLHDRTMDEARARLGDVRLEALLAEGKTMSREHAVEVARALFGRQQ